ncbi:hypothetical protein ACH4TU_06595 [Streptomyces physcomitrii]|uniref:hypothetical protein n=1 Tax=Streptomyces physcomitrii TaxID=2724184 RepID=UPI00058F2E09
MSDPGTTKSAPPPPPRHPHPRFPRYPALRPDLLAVLCALLLFVAAAVVGTRIEDREGTLHVGWPPLYANWDPHGGPGTPAALAVAVLVVGFGPYLARRLPWRALLVTVWLAAMAWTWSLALADGWRRGVARRLATKYEYLRSVDRFDDIGATLRDFTRHILIDSPDHWPPHVAGHPPGATLTFVYLDRIGLGGGAWAATFVLTVATSAAVAALVAVRALAGERLARRAAPFLVLSPAAVWAGVSADGYFAAVAAWAVALLALAATRRERPVLSLACGFGAGLLFGLTWYLSYGLVLFAAFAGAVLLLTRTARPLPALLAGALVVPLAFTFAGFAWWEAYDILVDRYYQGAGGVRPYGYWVWANLACTTLLLGAAGVAGLRRVLAAAPRTLRAVRTGRLGPAERFTGLVLTALLVLLTADLSGMSKAETERIWLPFALWLLPAAALLPRPGRRAWLAAQALLALAVNHLLLTGW